MAEYVSPVVVIDMAIIDTEVKITLPQACKEKKKKIAVIPKKGCAFQLVAFISAESFVKQFVNNTK